MRLLLWRKFRGMARRWMAPSKIDWFIMMFPIPMAFRWGDPIEETHQLVVVRGKFFNSATEKLNFDSWLRRKLRRKLLCTYLSFREVLSEPSLLREASGACEDCLKHGCGGSAILLHSRCLGPWPSIYTVDRWSLEVWGSTWVTLWWTNIAIENGHL